MPDTLRIIPLGGVGEVGKNITAIEAAGEILVVDCGLAFPEPEMLGHRPRHPRRDLPRGEPRPRQRDPADPRPRGPHRRRCPYVLPESPARRSTPRRLTSGLVQRQAEGAQAARTRRRSTSVEPGRRVRDRPLQRSPPFRVNHSIPDGMGFAIQTPSRARSCTPATSSSTTPRPTGGAPTWGSSPRSAIAASTSSSPTRPAPRSEGYTLSEATVGESLNQLVGEAQRARHRGDLRQQHRPRPAGDRRRLRPTAARWSPSGAAWSRTRRSRSSSATSTPRDGTLVRKDQLQRLAEGGAGGHDDRLAGRADVRPDPHEQPRPSQHHHRAGRHGDRLRLADPRQRGGGRARRSTTSSRRGRWSTTSRSMHCHVSGHGSREELKLMLGPRQAAPLHPGPRRVPDARAARPAGRGCRRRRRQDLRAGERPGGRVRRHARAAWPAACRPARCSWTASRRSTASTASSCATGAMLASDGVVMVALTVDACHRPAPSSGPDIVEPRLPVRS